MTSHYGRSEQGKRAYGVAPYPHGQMITLIGAITVKRGTHYHDSQWGN